MVAIKIFHTGCYSGSLVFCKAQNSIESLNKGGPEACELFILSALVSLFVLLPGGT